MADAVSGGMMDSVDMPADTKPDTPAMERSQTMPAPTESNSSNADPELDIMYQGRTTGIEGPPSENLYVKGIPPWIKEHQVKVFFETCGTVAKVQMMGKHKDGSVAAVVRMSSQQEAEETIMILKGQRMARVMPDCELAMQVADDDASTKRP